jgi:pimeloyl-ACP methyl ester carboxylesterase
MTTIKSITILISILIQLTLYGQNNPNDYWEHFILENDSLGKIQINVNKTAIDKKKPLLIFLEGSGNFPLFYKSKNGRYGTGITLDYTKHSSDYHIAIISKPGIPFVDTLSYSESGRAYYPINSTYNKYYSLKWRAQSASITIDYLMRKLQIDSTQVVIIGHSEGSQVAPAVAVDNSKVTHVVSIMGNCLNQLYDFIIQERINVEKGITTSKESQQIIDSLYYEYDKIYSSPNSIDSTWYGETYYKWSSFTLKTPIEYMLELDIPILYIGGGADQNQNIINMDFAKLEFMRKGKKNLTYKVFPDYDHFFQEHVKENGNLKLIDRFQEVNNFIFNWVKTNI